MLALALVLVCAAAAAASARAASSDRTIKACLLARRTPMPRLVIYGSSRAAKLEPSYLGSLLKEPAFNASLSAGTPEDVWALAHLAHDQTGGKAVRALWLLDLESFRPRAFDSSVLQTPTLARYFAGSGAAVGPAPEAAHRAAPRTCTFTTSRLTSYAPDGFRQRDIHDAAAARGLTLAQGLRRVITQYERIYRTRYPEVSPSSVAWVERTILAFNSWGVRPVIVLTPVHPTLLQAIGPAGWGQRHAEVLKLLQGLHAQFTLLDASRISVFGGHPADFYDGVHMRVANTRRLAAWIVHHARRDLAGS